MSHGEDRARQALIAGLNEDLAAEYRAIVAYAVLIALLRAEVVDEQRHARYLAAKVAALGGEPAVAPAPSSLTPDPRWMIEQIRRTEADSIAKYRERVAQAERAGDAGLKRRLEEFVADEASHLEDVEMILATWE